MDVLASSILILLLGFVAAFIVFAVSIRKIYETFVEEDDYEPLESSYEYR